MGGGGGRESDFSVCPRPLLQFLPFFQFMSDRLHQVTQVTSGYVRLRRRDGTWSSTTITWLIEADSSMTYLPILIIDQSPKDIGLEVKTLILEISFCFSTVRSLALVH